MITWTVTNLTTTMREVSMITVEATLQHHCDQEDIDIIESQGKVTFDLNPTTVVILEADGTGQVLDHERDTVTTCFRFTYVVEPKPEPEARYCYEFSFGDTCDGPLGAGASVIASGPQEAVDLLRAYLNDFIAGHELGGDSADVERVTLWFNPDAITNEDIVSFEAVTL